MPEIRRNVGPVFSPVGFAVCLFLFVFGGLVTSAAVPPRAGAVTSGRLSLKAGELETSSFRNLVTDPVPAFEAGKRYVVQLEGAITPEQRAALVIAGIHLGPYLPEHSYVVDLVGISPEVFASLPFVQWVGEFEAGWKLDPEIGRRLKPFETAERIALAGQGKLRLVVTLFPGATVAAVQPALVGLGAVVQHWDTIGGQDALTIDLAADRVSALAQMNDVQFVEEAGEITFRNASVRWIVQTNTLSLTPLYTAGITGTGQIVGIMDGRIRTDHCSFADTVPPGPNHRKIAAYNAGGGSDSHGTHVAGTAVGDAGANNDTRGIAYGGRLTFADVPSFNETAIKNALQLHHNQGARVHTNSWGDDGTTSYNGLARGIDVFSYDNEESLVMFAVTNLSNLRNPENAKNLLAVGATSDTPGQANHCSGGQGPTADGRRKPEVYAPGCGIQSASSSSTCGTVSSSGTSMACPAVAGSSLLVRQYYVDGYYPTGIATPAHSFIPSGALIKATLINSAVDMTGVTGYPSNLEGWGRIRLDDAIFLAGDTRKSVVLADVRNANGLSTGQSVEYPLYVGSGGGVLKVTLVWTEPAAASGASNPTINDLDLEVVSPTATLYRGNVFTSGFSAPGGTKDSKNNVEQVHINIPTVGSWTVRVVGAAVNVGAQGYALLATGPVDPASCSDGIQNQSEDRIDCGGPCPPCECIRDVECDDGIFCNGVDTCGDFGTCLEPSPPCTDPGAPHCNEEADRCDECVDNAECDDGDDCTLDQCEASGRCSNTELIILYGDLDGSGLVEITDVLCVLAAYAMEGACDGADIFPCDPDGQVEVGDVLAILGAYNGDGPCEDPCPP